MMEKLYSISVQWNQPITDQKVDSIIFKTARQFFV
jgi:hypothetical protein